MIVKKKKIYYYMLSKDLNKLYKVNNNKNNDNNTIKIKKKVSQNKYRISPFLFFIYKRNKYIDNEYI